MIAWTATRAPILAAVAGVCAVLPAAPYRAAASRQPRLTFHSVFTGVAPDGQHCTWEGAVEGSARGRLTIALRQVEEASAAARPIWHVASRWDVSDESGTHSFSADLEGMVDWKAGTIRLGGAITGGWLKGSWVEADGRLSNGDLAGSFAITPAAARP